MAVREALCTKESDDAPEQSTVDGAEGRDVIHKRSIGVKGHVQCSRCGITARVGNLKPPTQRDEDSRLRRNGCDANMQTQRSARSTAAPRSDDAEGTRSGDSNTPTSLLHPPSPQCTTRARFQANDNSSPWPLDSQKGKSHIKIQGKVRAPRIMKISQYYGFPNEAGLDGLELCALARALCRTAASTNEEEQRDSTLNARVVLNRAARSS
ncbi:hypothetical protein B0H14DRAFT_2711205 [Mycena olivaceomarginata]|nr:hypothetical protein B0H14DRAFT_2711205 [Mycena olivaceomarginata]